MRTLLLFCAALLSFLSAGCAGLAPDGPYKGDQDLYRADVAITASYNVFRTFLRFEQDNRAMLARNPKVRQTADAIRLNGKDWIRTAIALRDTVEANPGSKTLRAQLQSSVNVLQTAISESTRYLVDQSGPSNLEPASP